MTAAIIDAPTTGSTSGAFLACRPRIQAHARFAFRRVRCPQARADLAAEAVALAWRHFAALSARGKRPEQFATTLAVRCTQAVRGGRRLARAERATDVLSPTARARHGVGVRGSTTGTGSGARWPRRWPGTPGRKKLNQLYATGAVVLAAFVGAAFQSWWAFGAGAVVLLGLQVCGREHPPRAPPAVTSPGVPTRRRGRAPV